MIRMSVGAVRPERHDDFRLNPPQVVDDARDGLLWVRAVEMLIVVIQQ